MEFSYVLPAQPIGMDFINFCYFAKKSKKTLSLLGSLK